MIETPNVDWLALSPTLALLGAIMAADGGDCEEVLGTFTLAGIASDTSSCPRGATALTPPGPAPPVIRS